MLNEHLALLGFKVEDKVTGQKGIVTSVAFDLYGCIQAIVDAGLTKEGAPKPAFWLDISRLKKISCKPVIKQPYFLGDSSISDAISKGEKGPASKPIR